MRKAFSLLSLAALTVGLLGSCSKINERIDGLEKRVDGIENEQIASINTQITGITSSIADLGTIRSDISSLKQSASDHSVDIFNLEEADRALKDRILNLEDYLDDVLPNYAEKEWVEATFSTLAQYEATCDTIAKIDARIGALDTKLSKDIQDCADSLKVWVNKQFEGYYTAAEMDAKLVQMKASIDSAKASGKITDAKADSIATELTKTKTAVDTAKAAIRAEYRAAIDTAIKTSEGKLTKALNDAITEVNGRITSLTTRVGNLETEVAALTGRVDKLEKMIQSVTIVPAYSDGSVRAEDDTLYLDCIIGPASTVSSLTKTNFTVLVNKVLTKAVNIETINITDDKWFSKNPSNGTVSLKIPVKNYIPASADSIITVAVNIKNGISDFTTEFVPVYVAPKTTFKAVYNTNGDANTLKFYYDDVDYSGDGITVYEDGTANYLFDNSKPNGAKWGYNGNRSSITSVVIDASVAGYKGLTSTTFMFQGMDTATEISGAEYLDVSNVTDMSYMFNNFGGGNTNSHTTLNSVPDVSKWNTGNVTEMANIFNEYGDKSTKLDTVPNVSNWKTDNVTNMQQMFYNYGITSTSISCVLDLSGWDLKNVTSGGDAFKFTPNTFNVTIPAKTGEKSNESDKWYYGNGTDHIAPPTGKTFTPALAGVFSVSATKKVHFSQGNLYYNGSKFDFEANQYEFHGYDSANNIWGLFGWVGASSTTFNSSPQKYGVSTSTTNSDYGNVAGEALKADWGTAIDDKGTWSTLSKDEWMYLVNTSARMVNGKACYSNAVSSGVTIGGATYKGVFLYPDDYSGKEVVDNTETWTWGKINSAGIVFLPAAGRREGSNVYTVGDSGSYWSSTVYDEDWAYYLFFNDAIVSPVANISRHYGFSVRLVTEVK